LLRWVYTPTDPGVAMPRHLPTEGQGETMATAMMPAPGRPTLRIPAAPKGAFPVRMLKSIWTTPVALATEAYRHYVAEGEWDEGHLMVLRVLGSYGRALCAAVEEAALPALLERRKVEERARYMRARGYRVGRR